MQFQWIILNLVIYSVVLCVDDISVKGSLGEWQSYFVSEDQGKHKIIVPIQKDYLKNLLNSFEDKSHTRETWIESLSSGDNLSYANSPSVMVNPLHWKFRVEVKDANVTNPVKVLVQHGRTTKGFKLPYTRTKGRDKGKFINAFPARTVDLCPEEKITDTSSLIVTLVPSTKQKIEVRLLVEVVSSWQGWEYMSEDDSWQKTALLTQSSPVVVTSVFSPVNHGEKTETIVVSVETLAGSDCFCSIASIQQPDCPFFDSTSTAIRFGIWNNMLNKTAMIIKAEEYPRGFLVVVVATESVDFCGIHNTENYKECFENKDENKQLMKNMKISYKINGDTPTTLKAIFIIFVIYIITILVCVVLANAQFQYKFEDFKGMDIFWKNRRRKKTASALFAGTELIRRISETPLVEEKTFVEPLPENGEIVKEDSADNNNQNQQILVSQMSMEDPNFKESRIKVDLKVSDLSHKLSLPDRTKSIYQKSNLYLGNFGIMSLFYSVAVLQLAFQFSEKQARTGDLNICYFNSLCQKPLGPFLDFNHFYSNFGYVVAGITFIAIIHLRKHRYEKMKNGQKFVENMYGIPHQYGIYYTMGGALIMEGLLSAAYHVCPSQIAFQFDTTFMFLIAILVYVQLYQNRHCDVSSNSVQIFILLGIVLIIEAISIYFSSPAFWIIFCIFYILALFVMILNIYNIGAVRHDNLFVVHAAKMFFFEISKIKSRFKEEHKFNIRPNMIYLTIKSVLNIALCIFLAYKAFDGADGASQFFLLMFIANMFAYTIFYVIMKLVSGEKLTKTNCFYIIFSIIFDFPALYFFVNKASKSEWSHPESNDLNNDCIFLDYYDQHDVWHFMSSAGLFFLFMFVLTIDEDLEYTKRSEIRAF